jgi:hypothetical protein
MPPPPARIEPRTTGNGTPRIQVRTDAQGLALYTPDRGYQIGGAVGIGVGLGVLVGGIVLMLRSTTTYSFAGGREGALALRFQPFASKGARA